MIRIEITDLATEDKALLMKVSELLMHVAGHGMIMVPDHNGVNPPDGVRAIKKWLPTAKELTPAIRAHYQHCVESDLTTHTIKSITDPSQLKPITQETIAIVDEMGIPENIHVTDFAKSVVKAAVDIDTKIGHQIMESWLPTSNPAPREIPLPEEVFNAKPPYDPTNPAHAFAKTIAQGAVGLAEAVHNSIVEDMKDIPEKPKRTRKSTPKPPLSAPKPPVFEVIGQGEIDVIEETFIPDMPMVIDEIDTSMKLINKMTQLVTDKRLSQEDLIQIIKTSGLNEVIDVCHREDLVPLVNSNLEILLRTKA